ncbi:MAG: signal peptidase I [Elusimicrobia bacterium]|nr:signal peptidase I [Elusimicrobiota bacterium]
MSLRRLLLLAALGAAGALALRVTVGGGIVVASGSMEPTLPVGTHLWLDRVTLRLRAPRRGDIIVFLCPVPPREDMIKRVIAVGGQTVEVRRRVVYVDGKELEEPYVRHTRPGQRLVGDDVGPWTVPKDSLFVLGDDRDESRDSSVWKDPQTGRPAPFLPLGNVRGLVRGFY